MVRSFIRVVFQYGSNGATFRYRSQRQFNSARRLRCRHGPSERLCANGRHSRPPERLGTNPGVADISAASSTRWYTPIRYCYRLVIMVRSPIDLDRSGFREIDGRSPHDYESIVIPNWSVRARRSCSRDVRNARGCPEALKWSSMGPGGVQKKRLYELVTPDDTIASRLPSASFRMLP